MKRFTQIISHNNFSIKKLFHSITQNKYLFSFLFAFISFYGFSNLNVSVIEVKGSKVLGYEFLDSKLRNYDNLKISEDLVNVTPPQLTITEPIDVNVNSEKIVIKGNTDLSSSLKINSALYPIEKNGSFNINYQLKIGENKLIFEAVDGFGNITKLEKIFNRKDPCLGVKTCGMCGNPKCITDNSSCNVSVALRILELINNHRAANGLNKLTLDPVMTKAACDHSIWMKNTGIFKHNEPSGDPWTRCKRLGVICDAENIAISRKVSAEEFFSLWKNSSGHNKNMLGSHTKIGIGVAGIYATTDFW